jgi:hypothetical protein
MLNAVTNIISLEDMTGKLANIDKSIEINKSPSTSLIKTQTGRLYKSYKWYFTRQVLILDANNSEIPVIRFEKNVGDLF